MDFIILPQYFTLFLLFSQDVSLTHINKFETYMGFHRLEISLFIVMVLHRCRNAVNRLTAGSSDGLCWQ